MGIFDDFSRNAKIFAEKAVKKTGEVAESAKLSFSLKSEEIKLIGLFEELGKLSYEKSEEALIAAQILEIDEQKAIISQIKAEIAANSGKAICSGCGKDISVEAAFCSFCGKKQCQKKNVTEDCAKAAETACESEVSGEKSGEKCECCFKPLSCEEFVNFFKATMLKYGFAK